MDTPIPEKKSFFQPWMILLILPLIGIGAMILVLISADNQADPASENLTLNNLSSPLPQTLPPRTPIPTSTPVFGQSVPNIQLTDLNGDPFTLSDFAGRPIIVNFWASWCEPCKEEMPQLQAYSDAQAENGPLIIAVTDPDNAQDIDKIRAFIKEYGVTLQVGLDQGAALHYALGVPGLPTTFFINSNGIIQGRRIGEIDYQAVVDEVALLDNSVGS